jgi:anti-sigma factor RsiW
MKHTDFAAQLDAYVDGELVGNEARDMEGHARECAACAHTHERHLALRAAIRERLPALRAPGELRSRVRQAVRAAAGVTPARPQPDWRWLAAAAVLASVVVGTWKITDSRDTAGALAGEVLASHVRALMGTHLTDVASTDQHTVKPWFNGRLDFSPPVYDFAGRGYPLIGGRLDYIGQGAVAALVYGRRQHVIDVLLWPTQRGSTGGPPAVTRQGYHMLHWSAPDYTYWVVSDLGVTELGEFSRLLRQADSTAAR